MPNARGHEKGKALEQQVAALFDSNAYFVERGAEMAGEDDQTMTDVDVWAIKLIPPSKEKWFIIGCKDVRKKKYGAVFHLLGVREFIRNLFPYPTGLELHAVHVTSKRFDDVKPVPGSTVVDNIGSDNVENRICEELGDDNVVLPLSSVLDHWQAVYKIEDQLLGVFDEYKQDDNCPRETDGLRPIECKACGISCGKKYRVRARDLSRFIGRDAHWLLPQERNFFLLELHRVDSRLTKHVETEVQRELHQRFGQIPRGERFEFSRRETDLDLLLHWGGAAYLQTRSKIMSVLALAQDALELVRGCEITPKLPSRAFMEARVDRYYGIARRLSENPGLACKFPVFIQTWIMSWGGFFWKSHLEEEFAVIADDIDDDPENIPIYLELFEELFKSETPSFKWIDDSRLLSDTLELFLIPNALMGLGIKRRKMAYPDKLQREFPTDWEKHRGILEGEADYLLSTRKPR